MKTVITLPMPPTSNHMHTVAYGRKVSSLELQRWKMVARRAINDVWQRGPLSDDIRLTLHVYMGRAGDLDNRIKAVQDVMTGLVFLDDKQVCELHAYRHRAGKNDARVEVLVEVV